MIYMLFAGLSRSRADENGQGNQWQSMVAWVVVEMGEVDVQSRRREGDDWVTLVAGVMSRVWLRVHFTVAHAPCFYTTSNILIQRTAALHSLYSNTLLQSRPFTLSDCASLARLVASQE